MQVILPIQQWRHFRQYRVNQLAERDTHRHQRISKDTKRTPKVRNFIFNNEVPKFPFLSQGCRLGLAYVVGGGWEIFAF